MIGGTVIETKPGSDNIGVVVVEDQFGERLEINVEATAEARSISPGDVVWWQGRKAYWSPKNQDSDFFDGVEDVPLYRIGYSCPPRGEFKAVSPDPIQQKFMQDPPAQKWDGEKWI